jgi:hypothetical protein
MLEIDGAASPPYCRDRSASARAHTHTHTIVFPPQMLILGCRCGPCSLDTTTTAGEGFQQGDDNHNRRFLGLRRKQWLIKHNEISTLACPISIVAPLTMLLLFFQHTSIR